FSTDTVLIGQRVILVRSMLISTTSEESEELRDVTVSQEYEMQKRWSEHDRRCDFMVNMVVHGKLNAES
uniref:MATH domain-containing protein n=1 Tax=Steinernema glaseri TaxID=37863 RepID=A0A1I7Z1Q0_9BILA